MNRYDSYKDSGVEWVGEIPSHWINSRLKYVSEIVTGNTPPTKDEDNYEGGEFLWVKPNEINGLIPTNDTKQKLTIKGRSLSRVLPPFSVLVNGIGRIGVFGFSELPVSTNQQINSIVFNDKVDNRYGIFHVSMMKEGFLSNSEKVVVPILNKTKQENLEFILPPLSEQQQIVTFLDDKTQKIDSLIQQKEKKIELLKEKRISLINHFVTKGLNPNVEMKESGVEWIGEIPKHWNRNKLNRLSERIGDGLHSTPKYVDSSEYFFINGNNLVDGKIKIFDSTKCVSEEEFNKHFIKLNSKTILLSINGTIGNLSFYYNEKVILGKSSCYINLKENINNHFIYYVLKSESINKYFTFELTGTTIFNLSLNSIRNTPIVIPPENEQQQIVEYLEKQTEEIDTLIQLEQKKIDTLKEYRQSLISEVVTGKIKVV